MSSPGAGVNSPGRRRIASGTSEIASGTNEFTRRGGEFTQEESASVDELDRAQSVAVWCVKRKVFMLGSLTCEKASHKYLGPFRANRSGNSRLGRRMHDPRACFSGEQSGEWCAYKV
eukprot:5433266-Pyramimonas_sp.AAC.1